MATLTEHESLLFGVQMMHDELAGQFAALGRIRDDRRYATEHRAELLEAQLTEAYGVVKRHVDREREDVQVTYNQAERTLQEARTTTPEEMAAAAVTLTPVMNAAAEDPDALLRCTSRT